VHAVYRGPNSARAEGPDPATMAKVAAGGDGPVNASSSKPTQQESVWLNAWHDPVAGLKTHGMCVRLVDLYGDGDSKLLVADRERKLTVFKGANGHTRCRRLR
jgi:Bardet-Biedl syndrome 1 protein